MRLPSPAKLLSEQQVKLQLDTKRTFDTTGAYIDRLLVNVYSGPGTTDVYIDDLEIGPTADKGPFRTTTRPADPEPRPLAGAGPKVEFREQLFVDGKGFFLRGIRHTDTPLNVLRDVGLNAGWLNETGPPELIEQAARLKLRVVPTISMFTRDEKQLLSAEALQDHMRYFTKPDNVLVWNVGRGGLTADDYRTFEQAATSIEAYDPRPIATDVWDGLKNFSSGKAKMVGVHRWPLMSSLELTGYREWLNERRGLCWPGTFMWN